MEHIQAKSKKPARIVAKQLVPECSIVGTATTVRTRNKYYIMKTLRDYINLIETAQQGVAEGSLEEYGDTTKGQKQLAKVHKRAVDRVTSKQADTDPKYAKKNQDTANASWERLKDKD
jgi:hypothetical protein